VDEQEKILDFLKEIANQLGPAGEQAFRIVAERVYAESLIWVIVGSALTIFALVWVIGWVIWYTRRSEASKRYANDDEAALVFFGFGGFIIVLICGLLALIPSAMNLTSIEYATIARILNLVGGQ
jgi:hypothetical protein